MTIKLYTAEHCAPCHRVEELLKNQNNNIDGEDVKVIDVESDDGFKEFKEQILSKGDAAVPSAYKDGEKCLIKIEDDILHLICGEDDQPSHPTQLSDQPEEPESNTS
jgi:glutaredoxin